MSPLDGSKGHTEYAALQLLVFLLCLQELSLQALYLFGLFLYFFFQFFIVAIIHWGTLYFFKLASQCDVLLLENLWSSNDP